MKKPMRWLAVVLSAAVLACAGAGAWELLRTAPLDDQAALCRSVKQAYGWEVSQIHAAQEDQGVAALLTTAAEEGDQSSQTVMFLLERSWLPGRYRVTGSATGTANWGDYRYSDPRRAITVVYGDNREMQAGSYRFAVDGCFYGQEDLGDYVLGLYVTGPATDVGAVQWYDAQGNEIDG